MKQNKSRNESHEKVGPHGRHWIWQTTVAKLMAEMGALVLDADTVAREVRAPGGIAHAQILATFGTDAPQELRRLISTSNEAKAKLEAILHPLIAKASDQKMHKLMKEHPDALCFVYEATLLLEAGRALHFDAIVSVVSNEASRVARIQARDQSSADQAKRLISAQNSDDYRRGLSHYVIENHGDLDDLRRETRKVLDQFLSA